MFSQSIWKLWVRTTGMDRRNKYNIFAAFLTAIEASIIIDGRFNGVKRVKVIHKETKECNVFCVLRWCCSQLLPGGKNYTLHNAVKPGTWVYLFGWPSSPSETFFYGRLSWINHRLRHCRNLSYSYGWQKMVLSEWCYTRKCVHWSSCCGNSSSLVWYLIYLWLKLWNKYISYYTLFWTSIINCTHTVFEIDFAFFFSTKCTVDFSMAWNETNDTHYVYCKDQFIRQRPLRAYFIPGMLALQFFIKSIVNQ